MPGLYRLRASDSLFCRTGTVPDGHPVNRFFLSVREGCIGDQPEGGGFFPAKGVCKKAGCWKKDGSWRGWADMVGVCLMPSVFHDAAKAADVPGAGQGRSFGIFRQVRCRSQRYRRTWTWQGLLCRKRRFFGHVFSAGNGEKAYGRRVYGVVWLPAGDGAVGLSHVTCHFVSSTRLPPAIMMPPAMTRQLTGSFRTRNDRRMVMTTLSLSIGATKETSPA